MRRFDMRQSARTFIRRVATDCGVSDQVTDRELLDIAWEYTGFPSFFAGSDPLATFYDQLVEAFDILKLGTSK